MKRLKLLPDLPYEREYGTAGKEVVKSIGAYSNLPMRFGTLQISAPAVVLDNNSYDLLLGTSFLRSAKTITDMTQKTFSIMGYKMDLHFEPFSKN